MEETVVFSPEILIFALPEVNLCSGDFILQVNSDAQPQKITEMARDFMLVCLRLCRVA
jgi:hypothetical protein